MYMSDCLPVCLHVCMRVCNVCMYASMNVCKYECMDEYNAFVCVSTYL